MTSTARIRRAHLSDAAAIAQVHTQSWRETYARNLPGQFLDGLQFSSQEWTSRIQETSTSRSRRAIWVAEDDDGIVGFAAVGPDPEEETAGRLYSIYLLSRAQGTGVGRRLHTAALQSLAEAGFTQATLWVAADNAAAIRFYELADWRADFVQRSEDIGGVSLRLVRYRLPLAPSAATRR